MPQITLLSQETIDKIAAGEVVERPSSVVKELVENAIDAQATAVTVEIKNGGISFIRITDNGCGIVRSQVPLAFLRHSTSKIKSVEDLLCVRSLGFRGEALSSIAAVSQVELITKTGGELTGTRYVIEGSREIENEEIGAPDGTTFIVRNLFYNTPARQKFLKTAQTEGNYISDLLERLALSHPDISFKLISNGQTKMHTSGNSNEKDMIYHIYGRDITGALLSVDTETELFRVKGFIGKPLVARGNRSYENYFVNGRYIKSALLSKAIEEAYKGFLMQHQYPFCVLYFTIDTELLDVNVHPTKMELRFSENEKLYKSLYQTIRDALTHREFIPEVPVDETGDAWKKAVPQKLPEPFEKRRINDIRASVAKDSPYEPKYPERDRSSRKVQRDVSVSTPAPVPENQDVFDRLLGKPSAVSKSGNGEYLMRETSSYRAFSAEPGSVKKADEPENAASKPGLDIERKTGNPNAASKSEPGGNRYPTGQGASAIPGTGSAGNPDEQEAVANIEPGGEGIQEEPANQEPTAAAPDSSGAMYEQQSFLTRTAAARHKIIGQLFETYWLIEYGDKLFIIDQHAAHEKVLYEKTMARVLKNEFASQTLSPPIILTLNQEEQAVFERYQSQIEAFGYAVEPFGGKEYAVNAIPADFSGIDMKSMFIELLDDFGTLNGKDAPNLILEKVASMSCKAAVKGNQHLSRAEMEKLIEELLSLENPYQCPHGRPTIISMSKYEIEKKFKRIV